MTDVLLPLSIYTTDVQVSFLEENTHRRAVKQDDSQMPLNPTLKKTEWNDAGREFVRIYSNQKIRFETASRRSTVTSTAAFRRLRVATLRTVSRRVVRSLLCGSGSLAMC